MKIWAAFFMESDGFTYSADHLLGIYSTKAKSEDRVLKFVLGEEGKYQQATKRGAEVVKARMDLEADLHVAQKELANRSVSELDYAGRLQVAQKRIEELETALTPFCPTEEDVNCYGLLARDDGGPRMYPRSVSDIDLIKAHKVLKGKTDGE